MLVLLGLLICSLTAQGAGPVCATCHPLETARFLASPMGRSLSSPEPVPPGRVIHQLSGSELIIEEQNGHMVHRLTEHGLTAAYPIAYQIGQGLKGRTYVVSVGEYLLESPASWYRGHGWDVSPGYESLQLLDFDRPVAAECLFCHAGQATFADPDARRLATQTVTPILCDRCHGPTGDHVRNPSAKNIVNPARLSGTARDSVCEQCHVEGETRVLNPGKTLQDYHPGEVLEQTVVPYVLNTGEVGRAASQAEELAESQCARLSAGKLWCGSCHHPHGPAVDRQRQVRTVCITCHASLSKAAHPARSAECVSCHMPARPVTNIAHVAATDHRIHKPDSGDTPRTGASKVIAWRQPAPSLQQRDLGIAQIQIAIDRQMPGLAQEGYDALRMLPSSQLGTDADALSTLEMVILNSDPARAAALGKRVVELRPQCASCALSLGLALKQAGDLPEAEHQLLRAIDLDPSLMQAYAQLALLYDGQKRVDDAAAIVTRFLKWNPRNIQFRLAHSP